MADQKGSAQGSAPGADAVRTGADRVALPDLRTCDDCAEHIAETRGELPGLDGAALHIAVGALYGGSACDHVDYDDSDAARAMEALWNHATRQRDRARAENDRLIRMMGNHEACCRRSTALRDALLTIGERVTTFGGFQRTPRGEFWISRDDVLRAVDEAVGIAGPSDEQEAHRG